MRAISLWQPWASLMTLGSKEIETRSWPTNYRGPLLIHAAKRLNTLEEIRFWSEYPQVYYALEAFESPAGRGTLSVLPHGCLVGIVNLYDCKPAEKIDGIRTQKKADPAGGLFCENDLGGFARGRFGWLCKNAVNFDKPIPYRGYQGFFDVDEDIFTKGYCQYCSGPIYNEYNAEQAETNVVTGVTTDVVYCFCSNRCIEEWEACK